MGQHKYNPTAIKAKNGELPPKPKKKSKRESEREVMKKVREITGADKLLDVLGVSKYY